MSFTIGSVGVSFVVHEDDEQQICSIHRLDLGVRWLFDVVADNNMKKRLPKAFLTMYDESKTCESRHLHTRKVSRFIQGCVQT
jgi:hypothetical protein